MSSYLRGEADKGSWITCLLSNVEECVVFTSTCRVSAHARVRLFLSLWNVLHSLLTAIIRMFNSMLSHVGAIRFSCSMSLAQCRRSLLTLSRSQVRLSQLTSF